MKYISFDESASYSSELKDLAQQLTFIEDRAKSIINLLLKNGFDDRAVEEFLHHESSLLMIADSLNEISDCLERTHAFETEMNVVYAPPEYMGRKQKRKE